MSPGIRRPDAVGGFNSGYGDSRAGADVSHDTAVSAYLSALGTAERHPREEETDLATRAGDGVRADEARRALACAHLRFVASIAARYRNLGLPLEDLLSEGSIGLMQAARLYDPAHGTRFTTYAVYWIRRAILRALEAQRTLVHVPSNCHRQARSVRRVAGALRADLGREPTSEEVRRGAGLTHRQMNDLHGVEVGPVSLDAPISGDGDVRVIDVLPAAGAADPHSRLTQRDAADRVRCALDRLEERDREVMSRRYGLDGGVPESLRDIGDGIGLSREAIRLIERRALRRLRPAVAACVRGHRHRPDGRVAARAAVAPASSGRRPRSGPHPAPAGGGA